MSHLNDHKLATQRTPNTRKKDAPYYICKVVASWRADYSPQGARHDFLLRHVRRHCFALVNDQ